MLVAAALWIAASFYLWSLKRASSLFWQSLGMAAVAYPAFYRYVVLK